MTTIRVPASTSNLGPGFDSHGLALGLYLTLHLEPSSQPYGTFTFEGEGAEELGSATEENIIFKAMRFAAVREEVELRPARIRVVNEIPLARGLGSSGAAIVAGLSAFEILTARRLSTDKLLEYAAEVEGHSDNVAAALMGSFVVSCVTEDASVLATRVAWPEEVRVVVVIPEVKVRTEEARGVLPESISRADAVFNVQRASMLVAAISGGRLDLIGEAMKDRLHQPYRARLVPGLDEALALGRGGLDVPGLLGVALSGSGPTIAAFATGNFDRVAAAISRCFEAHGLRCKTLVLKVEEQGRIIC